ncbi:MAG: mevalonate kinase [Gammaproteobacteria bacterium]|nr:mevalonate kinase [Gammaproteobacteria bacterium]
MKAISPGKLILSGEHAVVYGRPAIAIAVDRYAQTTITPQFSKLISFSLLNFRYKDSFTIQTLREIKNRLFHKYQLFVNNECGIRDVLQTPFELAQFTLINFLDHLNSKIIKGFNVKTESTIPIGCGMGSSAAVILSVLQAIAAYFRIELNPEKALKLGYEAERLQHGFPSGLDLHASLHGGYVYFQSGQVQMYQFPDIAMFMANTGTPVVGTGECVTYVAERFKNDGALWDEFEQISNHMHQALQNQKLAEIRDLIKQNHRLLVRIGVVPGATQNFIKDLESVGAAAKICGAGAVAGHHGGMVLIVADDKEPVTKICAQYQYDLSPVRGASRGLHVIE